MYLSCLLIDVGCNPDRPRPGRLWLRNLYRVHQRLCMAFPSAPRKADDADFLKPFKPEDLDARQVHVKRPEGAGFLFRVDPLPGGRVMILVQSAARPDWDYAFQNARCLLAADPELKPHDPEFAAGRRLQFRLLANPTRKIGTINKAERASLSKSELKQRKGRNGKRVPVRPEELKDWLARQAERGGFSVDEKAVTVQPGYVQVRDVDRGDGARLRSALYEGTLQVLAPEIFKNTLVGGVGPAKAFGFGLLSVAPVGALVREETT